MQSTTLRFLGKVYYQLQIKGCEAYGLYNKTNLIYIQLNILVRGLRTTKYTFWTGLLVPLILILLKMFGAKLYVKCTKTEKL